MDILNCIMGSDDRILKLEPSFLNKMQSLWLYAIKDIHNCSPIFTHNAIMDIHNWIMDIHNYGYP